MANVILDHSVQVQQSLAELTFRAGVLCQCIDELKDQTTEQIAKLNKYFERAQVRHTKNVIPLYYGTNLYRFVHKYLAQFIISLDALVAEKCRFAAMLQNYEATLRQVMQEVCHG